MILVIRTDKPESELYIYDNEHRLTDKLIWTADRKLADELLINIEILLKNNKLILNNVSGIIIFTGEGSFTGLRIGTTAANTLAYSLDIPIVESTGEEWIKTGLQKLSTAQPGNYVLPKYSSEPNITKPKNP